jgi:Na+-transporting NADH:ubiquinone oxidoreductase subunit C
MHSNAYTYRFIIILTGFAALLLSFASTSLKSRQDFNRELDTKKNILKVVNLYHVTMTQDEIVSNYKKNIKLKTTNGNSLNYYECNINNNLEGYILPISGKGLWSTINGFLALNPDLNTIKGITFYEHGETPGLGGEIEKEWFTSQFIGKKIFDSNKKLISVEINKGKVSEINDHEVNGVSGATLTTKGVNDFLLKDLKNYEQFLKQNIDGGSDGQ